MSINRKELDKKISATVEYIQKFKDGTNDALVETIVNGFNTIMEYQINQMASMDDIMENEDGSDFGEGVSMDEGIEEDDMQPDGDTQTDGDDIDTEEVEDVDSDDSAGGSNDIGITDAQEEPKQTEDSEQNENTEEKPEQEEVKDKEGRMIKGQLLQISEQSDKLARLIKDEEEFKAWFQSKVAQAQQIIDDVFHYYENRQNVEKLNDEVETEQPILELGETSKKLSPEELNRAVALKVGKTRAELEKLHIAGVISDDEYITSLNKAKTKAKEEILAAQ